MVSALARMDVRLDEDALIIDMSRLRHVRPVHMVAALARAHGAAAGVSVHLEGPSLRDPGVYAARMRVGSRIAELGGTHTLPTGITEHDRAASLLEVSPIATRDQVRELAQLVHAKVTSVDPALANALFEGICEIGLNVQDHAGVVGYVAAQTMPTLGELRFAIGDAGRGFLSTLRDRGATDHRSAISLALRGVSSLPEADRGTGVKDTAEFVTELGGEILMISGDAEVSLSATTRRVRQNAETFQGSLVEASIPLPSGKHAAQLL